MGDHPRWNIGLTKEPFNRKGEHSASPEFGVWCFLYMAVENAVIVLVKL